MQNIDVVLDPARALLLQIGAGEHSAALRLELRDDVVTLTDEAIEAEVAAVLEALQRRLGARLRG